MCGIVGGFGLRCKKRDILASHTLLSHRGRDESIFTACGSSGFWGMNRLSIQDSQVGLYPFRYKQYSLIFNGEIYNLPELTTLLARKKIHCKTKCDAEVILPLFDLFGIAAFKKIEGMFAIAIYDNQKECFYLARDLFGEKPLYYTQLDRSCFFSSELQGLPTFIRQVSEGAIPEFLTFGFLNHNRTFFKNVFKVMPGECVQLTAHGTNSTQYDQLSHYLKSDLEHQSPAEIQGELKKRLQKTVAKKLVGSSPIGLFLSGGLDSSLLTALVQDESTKPAFTYSIGFGQSSYDESAAALFIAKLLKTKHHHIRFEDKDVRNTWSNLFQNGDEPISDPALLPTYLLAEQAKKDVKVVLTGEGADEIFGGYKRYQKLNLIKNFKSSAIAQMLTHESPWNFYKLITPFSESYSPVTFSLLWQNRGASRAHLLDEIHRVWQETRAVEKSFQSLPVPQNLQLHDLRHYVPEQLCMKTDKTLMLQTIESRAPYLDRSLLPFLTLSGSLISKNPFSQTNKILLRRVADEYLPQSIVNRPKHGFSLPIGHILQEVLPHELQSLRHADQRICEWVSQTTIDNLVNSFVAGNLSLKNDLWNLLTLNTWLSTHN